MHVGDHAEWLLMEHILADGVPLCAPDAWPPPYRLLNRPGFYEHQAKISAIHEQELQWGWIAFPPKGTSFPIKWVHPLSGVPKSDPQKIRVVEDMSCPPGRSLNDSIRCLAFTNTAVREAEDALAGPTILQTLDLVDFYKQLAVHPSCYPLLVCRTVIGGQSRLVVNTRPSFGIRHIPEIGNRLAQLAAHAVRKQFALQGVPAGCFVVPLQDDFFLGSPVELGLGLAWRLRDIARRTLTTLGLPQHPDGPKSMPPNQEGTTVWTKLVWDGRRMEVYLTPEKLAKLREQLQRILEGRPLPKSVWLSIHGYLMYCAEVVLGGRVYLHAIGRCCWAQPDDSGMVSPSDAALREAAWWRDNAHLMQGKRKVLGAKSPQVTLFSDATGCGGVGIWIDGGRGGFAALGPETVRELCPWVPEGCRHAHIWETAAVLCAVTLFGEACLANRLVLVRTDNPTCNCCINKHRVRQGSRAGDGMRGSQVETGTVAVPTQPGVLIQALEQLLTMLLSLNLRLVSEHILGRDNPFADCLSRWDEVARRKEFFEMASSCIPESQWLRAVSSDFGGSEYARADCRVPR